MIILRLLVTGGTGYIGSHTVCELLKNNYEVDLIEIDLKRLWNTLSNITGEVNDDDLLNEIFSKFCLGK